MEVVERGGSGIAKAAFAVAVVGVAVWGISRMLSDDSESQEKKHEMKKKAPAMEESYLPSSRNYRDVESEGKHGSYTNHIITRPSPVVHFKMNTDGTCHPSQGASGNTKRGPSAYAGILRDDHGRWVRGFRGFIGASDNLTAEFHGILKGLRLLDRLGFVESSLDSDCEAAVKWINDKERNHPTTPIIKNCWKMIKECRQLKEKNRITVSWCCEDTNKCADKLADMAFKNRVGYEEIINLPSEIKDMVVLEATMQQEKVLLTTDVMLTSPGSRRHRPRRRKKVLATPL